MNYEVPIARTKIFIFRINFLYIKIQHFVQKKMNLFYNLKNRLNFFKKFEALFLK